MRNPNQTRLVLSLTGALSIVAMAGGLESGVSAQSTAPAAAVSASTGIYQLDPNHTSVIARIGHGGGISISTFRFGKTNGTLDWNSASPTQSKVDVHVDPASIMTPVPNFAQELAGERFLNTAKFPDSQFVSKAIRLTGPNTGVITGDLTLMGVTRPVEVEARLVGAGKNMRGDAVIGLSGKTTFNRADFGFTTMMGPIGKDVELVLDLEFKQAAAAK